MKTEERYMKIMRYGKSYIHSFEEGDLISITEKIDGSNASFIKDEGNPDGFSCFSRKQKLHQGNQLSGFYEWCKDNINPEELLPNTRYYGEWLTKHKIVYKEDAYRDFYFFNLRDNETGLYLSEKAMRDEAARLNLKTPELFYLGDFISFEHLQGFIGKSTLTETGDGGGGCGC